MNDPERLLLSDASERERALLSAGAHEEPSADALSRLSQALGLTVVGPPLSSVPRALETAHHAPTHVHGASWLGSKWLLLGAAGMALLGAIALTRTSPAVIPRAQVSTPGEASAKTPVAPVPGVESSTGEQALPAPDARPASEAHADAPPALRDELTRLEHVRTELRAAHARAALSALDEYDRQHPRGTLREEAVALRIETLLALHERAHASKLAHDFLLDYPRSVHGARVRSQLEPRGAR
jgi:hypothetical protein